MDRNSVQLTAMTKCGCQIAGNPLTRTLTLTLTPTLTLTLTLTLNLHIRFKYVSRKKAWPVVDKGIHELIIVNIFLICRVYNPRKYSNQRDLRWQLVCELVHYAAELEGNVEELPRTPAEQQQHAVGRFHPDAYKLHHRDSFSEYVTPQELRKLHDLHSDDPRPPSKKRPRASDANKVDKDGNRLVRNPYWHSSVCVVCWAGITNADRANPARLRRKQKPTSFYCRECSLESRWTYKVRVGQSFHRYHPRLCSEKCFKLFHTREIHGLDHHQVRRTRTVSSRTRSATRRVNTPQPVRRANRTPLRTRFDV